MNLRNTKQRQAILEAIEGHGGHLTADQIYALVKRRFPRLSLGTVYRNLRVLVAQGSVRELDVRMGLSYFEPAKDSHYHLVCRLCGEISDAEMKVARHLNRMTRATQSAPQTGGFLIEEHRLDFIGVCQACQSKQSRTGRRKQPPKSG